MLTKGDKTWFEEHFASKKESGAVRDSVDLLRNKVTSMSVETYNFKFRLDSIEAAGIRTEEKVDRIQTTLDGFAGRIADLEQENKMGAVTLSRHTRQLQTLAKKAGVKLES